MSYDVVTMRDCASNFGRFVVPSLSEPGKRYVVTLSGSEGPAHCTCKAFEFSRDRNCKHVEMVWREACLYNPQWRDGKAKPGLSPEEFTYTEGIGSDERCPACGGPTVLVRRAV